MHALFSLYDSSNDDLIFLFGFEMFLLTVGIGFRGTFVWQTNFRLNRMAQHRSYTKGG